MLENGLFPFPWQLSEAEAVGLERELQEVARQERAQEAEERAFWRRLVGHELEAAAAGEEVRRRRGPWGGGQTRGWM